MVKSILFFGQIVSPTHHNANKTTCAPNVDQISTMITCPGKVDPPYIPLAYSKTRVYRGIYYLLIFAFKHILNDSSNVTDRVFAIFSKLCKILKRKFQGSAKIYETGLRGKIMRVNLFYKVP